MAKSPFQKKVKVQGAAQLQRKIAGFRTPQFGAEVVKQLAPIAHELAEDIRQAARAQGAPEDVARSVFSYSKTTIAGIFERRKNRLGALVGVNKGLPNGPSYFEWKTTSGPGMVSRKGSGGFAGATITRKRAKGTILGMSLASIWEYGSSNREPRPFFYPTITRRTAAISAALKVAMERAIEAQAVKP